MAAYDMQPLDASITTFEALARGLTQALLDPAAIVDVNSFGKRTQAATGPLLAAATLMASYLRSAVADLDVRVSACEARLTALEPPSG